jgi:putative transposase
MSWTPAELTRAQLEERRLEAARLLRQGKLSQSEIATHLGVTPAAVHKWRRRLDEGGKRALRRAATPGRPCELTREQEQQLFRLLDAGAAAAGFDSERWTLPRVRQLIEREFGVSYHARSLSAFLRRRGWSRRQPASQDKRRDEELIRAWLSKGWPRIKKVAATRARDHLLR